MVQTSFLTFRLHGTLPAATGRELKAELRQAQEAGTDHRRAQKQFSPSSMPCSTVRPLARLTSTTREWPKYWPAKS